MKLSLVLKPIIVTVVALLVASCGGSSNDQGTSLTLYGFFDQAGTPISGATTPLSSDVGFSEVAGASGSFNSVLVWAGFQNNLVGQTARLEGIFMEYTVNGATTNPPSSSQASGGVLGTSVSGSDSSLPDAAGGGDLPTSLKTPFQILPSDVRSWMILNKDELPPLPFDLNVSVYGVFVLSSGDRIESNRLEFPIIVIEDNAIPGTPGSSSGGSSSGGATSSIAAQ